MEVRGCIAGQSRIDPMLKNSLGQKVCCPFFLMFVVCGRGRESSCLVFFFLGEPRGKILRLGPTVWVAGLGSFSVQLVADIFLLSSNFCRSMPVVA